MHTRTPARRLEVIGLLVVLAALAAQLVTAGSLMPYSDPANWFAFGRNFTEQFGDKRLAYGFPLLVAVAIQVVGPFYAFLINVPLLLLLTLLVHAFSRRLFPSDLPRAALVAPFGAAFAVLIFLQINGRALAKLANPYRDPLSHVLVLLACLLLLGFRHRPARSLGPVVAAGLLLAYACSTRETAVLMLLPLFLFATMAKLEDRALPYRKPLLVFGLAFALGCIPLLVENQLVSGNALVPAQASKAFERGGVLTPGVASIHFSETLPSVMNHLRRHFGTGPLLLWIAGFVAALRYRQGAVLFLCLPAIAIYTLFYGSYYAVIPRYLFVVDLFALPVVGFGAAALFHFALGAILDQRVQRRVAHVGLAAVLILAAATALRGARFDGGGFRLAQARQLALDVGRRLPPDARVIGDRPLGQILSCFLDRPVTEVRMYRRSVRFAHDVRGRVRALAAGPAAVYAASANPRFRSLLASEFDLEPVAGLPTRPYRLDRRLRGEEIRIDRVLPWTRKKTQMLVPVGEAGDHVLSLDVGRLSKEPRRFARVLWGEEVLDESPSDGIRYYRVGSESGGSVMLGLESDRPVPGSLAASIRPIGAPLRLSFHSIHLMDYIERLSDGFQIDADYFPEIPERGSIDVPTVGWQDGFFLFTAELRIEGRPSGWKRRLTVRSGGRRLYDSVLTQGARSTRRADYKKRIVFSAPPGVVAADDTRLHWSLGAPVVDASDPARLWIRDLVVYRIPTTDTLRIEMGSSADTAFIEGGFHARESSDDGAALRWRWTNGRGRLRLFAWPPQRPLRLSVRTLQGARPAEIAAPSPRFRINGKALTGATRREPAAELERVTYRFDVPADWMVEGINLLEIRSGSWIPTRAGAESDRRPLGIMLEGISLESLPAG